ncbi:MAG TPA: hypothetical protein VEA99_15270 [Gemmatimonadaceae bacterium]|nr:hypothetical protein [Gemmatimonadaceae bacterium]
MPPSSPVAPRLDAQCTVSEVLRRFPGSGTVLTALGVSDEITGATSIVEAAESAGVDAGILVTALEAVAAFEYPH